MNFYQDQNNRKHNLIPIKISKNNSDKVIDLLKYNNHYALIKKIKVFLGERHKLFVCRRCLISYTSENMFLIHKPISENNDITTNKIRVNHIFIGKIFSIGIRYIFRIIADLEADNETEGSKAVCNKTANNYKQNPVCHGYFTISELNDVLKSC